MLSNKFRGRFRKDKQGLSSIITVAGIIAVILTFVVGPILTIYVPIWTKEAETEHMEDVENSFSMLRSNINKMIERNKVNSESNVRLKLGAELNNLLLPDSTGSIHLRSDSPEFNIYNSDNNIDLYAKSLGSIEYSARNNEYTDQRYIYENGAVIVEQGGSSTMELLPDIDIQRNVGGKLLVDDESIRGNLPGYDTSGANAVYYNFSGSTSDVSLTYDIYNNNNNIYESDFDLSADSSVWTQRKNDWFVEHKLAQNNIIAKWTFSETEDDVFEESSGSLSTLEGSFKGGANHTEGKFDEGVEFPAISNSYITIPNEILIQITGSHTLECWIYPYSVTGDTYIISKLKDSTIEGYGLMLSNGELKYIIGDGTSYVNLLSSGADIKPDKWTHVAGTWDGSKMYVYVDGQQKGNKTFNGPLASNSFKLVFGSNQAESGNYFDGKMDEITFSNVAKTSFDISDGTLSVRGDIWGGEDESIAVLDYLDHWVVAQNNGDWLYRKKLTIQAEKVEEDLINFPVLVSFTDADLITKAKTNGYDIVFTDSDGVTRMDHEIESYSSSSGTLIAWVSIPQLDSSVDYDIYMYYGNSAISSATENPGAVWDSYFVGAWHLKESPSGAAGEIKDSTSNTNDGKTEGSMNSADSVQAKIGKGLDFDETDDLIRFSDSTSLDSVNDKGTISLWLWWDDADDGDHQIVMTSSNRFETGNNDGFEWASQDDGEHFFYPWGGNGNNYNLGSNPFTDKRWHHLAVTLDQPNKDVDIYVDGSAMSFSTENVTTWWTSLADMDDWLWGGNPDRSTRYFDGMFDEIHVSDTVRSIGWLKTEYNNQNSPASFMTRNAEESIYHIAKYDIRKPRPDGNIIYRKRITIKASEVTADQVNFPVLVSLTDSDLKNKARSDGYDIYFTDITGETRLDHEIESYDSSTGTLVAWVRIVSLSSTSNTPIYIYYGNPNSADQSNPSGVWNSNFKAVWHLKENPGGGAPQIMDSTSNDNDGSALGSMTSSDMAAGKLNGAVEFDGSNDKINVPADASLDISGNATISGWFKLPSVHNSGTSSRILIEKYISNDYDFTVTLAGMDYIYSSIPKGSMVFKTENNLIESGIRYKYTSRTSWSANTWYYFSCVVDANDNANNSIYINSVSDVGGNIGGSTNVDLSFNTDWHIGGGNVDTANINTGVNHSDATLDEFRVSSGIRSLSWIQTEYSNQNDPGNFYTVGNEETEYLNDSVVILEVSALANDYTGKKQNAYVIFDYQSDTDYKYAGLRADEDKWVIGHRTSSDYDDKVTKSETINTNTWYDLQLYFDQDKVILYADNVYKINYTFTENKWGKFGLANDKSHSHFDDLKIYFNVQNGIQIWVNNKFVGNAKSTSRNSWDGPYDKLITNDLLNEDSTNVIKIKNVYTSSKLWAVRNVKVKGNPKEVSISLITIENRADSVGGSSSHVIHTKLLRKEQNDYILTKTNITIELTTRYFDAWWNYFNNKLNETGTNLNWEPDILESDYYLRSVDNFDGSHTIYITLRKIESLKCTIAVVEVTVD